MQFSQLKDRFLVFWVLQATVWLAYWSFVLVGYGQKFGFENSRVYLHTFVFALTGFLITLIIRIIYQRYSYQPRAPFKLVAIIAVVSSVATALWVGLNDAWNTLDQFPPGYSPFPIRIERYLWDFFFGVTILMGWSVLYFLIRVWRDWEVESARTEVQTRRAHAAQLQMLRYQLNPHFLFNSLGSIRALIDEDEKVAKDMVTDLSEFLRYSLISRDSTLISLDQELEAIRHYIAIEKRRYEDKLEVIYDIDADAGQFSVPSFIIHPVIENAIKYGMRTSTLPLQLSLAVSMKAGALRIAVSNSGKWIPPTGTPIGEETSTVPGLQNLRQRLEQAFPERYRLGFSEREGRVYVEIEILKEGSRIVPKEQHETAAAFT